MSKQYLQVSKGLKFRIGEQGELLASISRSSGEFYASPEILSLILLIAQQKIENADPKKLSLLLQQHLAKTLKNAPSAKELPLLLEDLKAAGVLLEDQEDSEKYMQNDGFADPWIQWAMVSDAPRSLSYIKALFKHIDKNSVVLDVGAGTGILSASALQAGAKKVIAIEETQASLGIIPLLKRLNLPATKEKFTLFATNSADAPLPSGITLVVSELFGNDPFQEGVLPTLRTIAKNLGNAKANYIPKKLEVFFELITLTDHYAKHRINWQKKINPEGNKKTPEDFYNFFAASASTTLDLKSVSFPLNLTKNNFQRASLPLTLGETRLDPVPQYSSQKQPFSGKKSVVVQKNKDICGILWFRVWLDDSISISSHPLEQDACDHWSPIALPLLDVQLLEKEKIDIRYHLNDDEDHLHCALYVKDTLIAQR